ncbi:MAG: ClbS/DfsB family four-helix bundle protein [Anaerolineales bacterium]
MSNPNSLDQNKATLIRIFNETRSSILQAASSIPDERVGEVFVGSWGILELLAHLRGWDLTNVEAAKDILAGKVPDFYTESDNDWASYNAKLVSEHRQADLEKMIASVDASRSDLAVFLYDLDADDIFGDHGVRRGSYKVTIGSLIEADTKDGMEHLDQICRFLE